MDNWVHIKYITCVIDNWVHTKYITCVIDNWVHTKYITCVIDNWVHTKYITCVIDNWVHTKYITCVIDNWVHIKYITCVMDNWVHIKNTWLNEHTQILYTFYGLMCTKYYTCAIINWIYTNIKYTYMYVLTTMANWIINIHNFQHGIVKESLYRSMKSCNYNSNDPNARFSGIYYIKYYQ